jgi:hypothetical protein
LQREYACVLCRAELNRIYNHSTSLPSPPLVSSRHVVPPSCPSTLTTAPLPSPVPKPKHFVPFVPRLLHSHSSPNPLIPTCAPDTPSTIIPPEAQIPILNPARGVIRVNLAHLNLGQDHARKPVKQLIDVIATQRRHLDRHRDPVIAGPATRRLIRHLAPVRRNRVARMQARAERRHGRRRGRRRSHIGPVDDVALVPREDNGNVWPCERPRVVEERLQLLEAAPAADVVDEDGAGCAPVVGARYGAEALGACRVPELELDALAAVR